MARYSATRHVIYANGYENVLLQRLLRELTVDIPTAGEALGNLSRNASYVIAKRDGKIGGIPVLEVGGKLRVPTAPIRKVLGLGDAVPIAPDADAA
jgi:hypothetical protein